MEASRQKTKITIAISGEDIKQKNCSDSTDVVQESSSMPVIDTLLSISEAYVSR